MLIIAFFMVRAAPRLLVYYTSTPSKIELSAVTADGERQPMQTPAALLGVEEGLHNAKRKIRRFLDTTEPTTLTPAGGYLEYTIVYSVDSIAFDQSLRVTAEDLDD